MLHYETLMYLHLFSVLPCVVLGLALFVLPKGTLIHRRLGATYMILMLFTAAVSLLMPAKVGVQFLGHFGWIHAFSFLTIYTVPGAYRAARRGNIAIHKRKMLLLYVGAIGIAGGFTLTPGRYLHGVLFG